MALKGLMTAGDPVEPSDHQVCPGGGGGMDQGLGGVGGETVVSVHKLEILPGSGVHSRVAGGRGAGIGLVNHMKTLVLRGRGLAQSQTAVSAAVVDQPHLQLPPGLSPNALQAGGQIFLCVIYRHNNTHQRAFHSATPLIHDVVIIVEPPPKCNPICVRAGTFPTGPV